MGRLVVACCVVVAGCGFSVAGSSSVDGSIDPDSKVAPTDWWDPAYPYRRQITVRSTVAAVPASYSVMVSANTAALVTAGHARTTGVDWRVVWRQAAGTWVELDRWIDDAEGTQWNGTDTRTWFALPSAMAANALNSEVFVYYGAASSPTPPANLDRVFLFGDDFEAGLGKWTANGRGEAFTDDIAQHRGGGKSLRLDVGNQQAGGVHRDITLPPTTLLFSHYVRQAQTGASFEDVRAFDTIYSQRSPEWVDTTLVLSAELDSNDEHQVWSIPLSIRTWTQNLGTNTWRRIEMIEDTTTNQVRARRDGGTLTAPLSTGNGTGNQARSIALEGQDEGGRFWVDNYVIRLYVDPEPTTSLGDEETRS